MSTEKVGKKLSEEIPGLLPFTFGCFTYVCG